MKHAALRQKALRIIKRHRTESGTFSMKPIKGGGWVLSWNEEQPREVRKTIADHARDV